MWPKWAIPRLKSDKVAETCGKVRKLCGNGGFRRGAEKGVRKPPYVSYGGFSRAPTLFPPPFPNGP